MTQAEPRQITHETSTDFGERHQNHQKTARTGDRSQKIVSVSVNRNPNLIGKIEPQEATMSNKKLRLNQN